MSQNGTKREPFGQVAIRRGYVSEQQVQDALAHQRELRDRNEKHKLIGLILLEMGALGTTELIDILKVLDVAYTHATPGTARHTVKA
jgi:hypothetical protein